MFKSVEEAWPARNAADGPVQLNHETGLSTEDYVRTQAWTDAKLASCPNHPGRGCRFSRHGTYGRKTPFGLRIARYYGPDSQMTLSLLPQFMAAWMAGTLQSVEDSVAAGGSLAAAAKRVRRRRQGDPRAARRWIRRRVDSVRLVLVAVIGLFPDLYAGTSIGIDAFRDRTGTGSVLVALRLQCLGHKATWRMTTS